jgi:hypothetical protein
MHTRRILLVVLLGAAGGCTSYRMNPVSKEAERDLLPFLGDGEIRKAEVVGILGRPSYEHEADRVVSYRMARDTFGALAVVGRQGRFGWRDAQFNLVLAFDEDEILQEHVLLQLKEKGKW